MTSITGWAVLERLRGGLSLTVIDVCGHALVWTFRDITIVGLFFVEDKFLINVSYRFFSLWNAIIGNYS